MTSPVPTPPFDARLMDLPDEELVSWVWTWWIQAQMTAKGIPLSDVSAQLEEVIIRETLASDTEHEAVAGLEKAIKAIALRDVSRGAKMFRTFMARGASVHAAVDEAATGRRKQRAIAKKPREDALNKVIRILVAKRPDITVSQLFQNLRELKGSCGISDVTNSDIYMEVSAGHGKSVNTSALKDRLSRVKRKMESR